MGYVLGLDLGTSSLKGVLVNKKGDIVQTVTDDYPLIQLKTGYNEQDPDEWINAATNVINELSDKVIDFRENLEGISFSGQMHSLVLLDQNKKALRNAILWNDIRTTKQSNQIMEDFDELLTITKNRSLEGFTLPKILWVQQEEPSIWSKVRHIMLPKDYLGLWMTNNHHMDYSDAAGTLLLNLTSKKWSETLLDKYHIPESYMPSLIESSGFIGYLRDELIAKFGFLKKVQVFAGGADNACAAVGAGIIDRDTALVSIGTSGVFLAPEETSEQSYKGKLHLFHHAIPDSYYSMGVTLSAGYSLDWFKKNFAPEVNYDELLRNINEISAGADGLLFTPYIAGERTPYVDSLIRGSFIGIDAQHTLLHFTKAVLEGITFSLKDSQLLMEKIANKKFKRIVSVGGGAKNKEWLQIQANIFDTQITTLETEQGPGLGAAMIAAVGLGWFETMDECTTTFVNYTDSIDPEPEEVKKYQHVHSIYQEIYNSTKDISQKLQKLN